MLDCVQHHRANICRRRLQEIAEELQIMLDVAQASRARNETQDGWQAVNEFQILRMAAFFLLTMRSRLFSHPRADSPD
jgi:hypothetical protein